MTNLLLVDDHPIIRSGVEGLLRGSPFAPVAQAANAAEAEAALERDDIDIVLLDLNLPDLSGVEVLRRMRARGDQRPVVILTAEVDDKVMLEAYRLGLHGLVLKHAAPDLLLNCLEEVRRGGRWIDQNVLQRALTMALDVRGGDGLAPLSPRERQIVGMVTSGARNQEIAESLGITPGTVKVHLHRIYEKLGVGSRSELVIYARDNGWR
jgi:two-component system nitrate/nitrite response regulator NarL